MLRTPALPWLIAGSAAALILFYFAGIYTLARAYQEGTMLGGVVVSDFFARIGAIFLGAVAFAEPIAGRGTAGLARAAGFLGGSLLLGRFSGATVATAVLILDLPEVMNGIYASKMAPYQGTK